MNRALARLLLTTVLLVGGLAISPLASAVPPPLVLRVNDVVGKAGDVVAIVLRTTSARPIRQGRISIRPRRRPRNGRQWRGSSPFVGLQDYSVLSGQADALAVGVLQDDANGQRVTLQFNSSSASVNRTDGTLAVLHLRLRDRLRPNEQFLLEFENVELRDANGSVIKLELLPGILKIQSAQKPAQLRVDSSDVEAGEDARFGIESLTSRPLGSGRFVLEYDPAIAAETPRVWLNKKQGTRKFSADTSVPGRIVVDFESRDGSFNATPGEILSVRVETREGIAVGHRAAIRFDAKATVLRDPQGNVVRYRLRNGALRFVADHDDSGDDDDDDDGGDGGVDDGKFDATALTADLATGLIGLADGTIVLAMPQLQWDSSGDFTDLASLATAIQSGIAVRVRGEGTVNAQGANVATEIRADLEP